MKSKFKLTKTNWVLFAIASLIPIAQFGWQPEYNSFEVGRLIGELVGFFIFPAIIAWIIWLISGRKENGGTLAFNIVLILIFIGQLSQFAKSHEKRSVLAELDASRETFTEELTNNIDSENFKEKKVKAITKFSNSYSDSMDKMSKTSYGTEKEFYQISSNIMKELNALGEKWHQSISTIEESGVLLCSLLKTDSDFVSQKQIIQNYIDLSRKYFSAFDREKMRNRFKSIGVKNRHVRKFMMGFIASHLKQKPIFDKLLEEHIKSGETLMAQLNWLQKNKTKWYCDSDTFVIEDRLAMAEFTNMTSTIEATNNTINFLSRKMLELK